MTIFCPSSADSLAADVGFDLLGERLGGDVERAGSIALKAGTFRRWGCAGDLAERPGDVHSVAPVSWLTGEPYICTVWPTMSDQRQLTPRQKEVLEYIQDETDARQRPPTVREIGAYLAVSSPGTINDHLAALENGRWIERGRGKARSIRLLKRLDRIPSPGHVAVRLLGRIAAGHAVDAAEDTGEHIGIDKSLLRGTRGGPLFAVRVTGDSMMGRGICEGDIAVAEADVSPRVGDVVVALIDQKSTLKTMTKGPRGFFLKAENHRYPDLVPVTEMVIQGVVRVLVRSLS